MRHILLFALVLFLVACSDDKDGLPYLETAEGAPFTVPVLNWGCDSAYVTNHLPTGYELMDFYTSDSEHKLFLDTYNEANDYIGYNLQNGSLFSVDIETYSRNNEEFYTQCTSFITAQLGLPVEVKMKDKKAWRWTAANLSVLMYVDPLEKPKFGYCALSFYKPGYDFGE